MEAEQLLEQARALAEQGSHENVTLADAQIAAFLLDNCAYTQPDDAVFFGTVNCSGIAGRIAGERSARVRERVVTPERAAGIEARAYTGARDFGHTAPLWDDILRLGLCGLRQRVQALAVHPIDPEFPEAERIALDAALRFVRRAAETAERAGKSRMAQGLRNLETRPPADLYEAMQLIFVYYTLQHHAEGTNLRTLGRLDRLFAPFLPCDDAEALTDAFMQALDDMHAVANIPFMLCGADAEGRDATNAASYMLLRSYIRLKPANVKLHILCTPDTPEDFLREAMEGIRSGANSMVFLNDGLVTRSLEKLGEAPAAARDYSVVGCYECGGREETACTCNGRVNIPKALELALHGGRDGLTGERIGCSEDAAYETFEALYAGFKRELAYLVGQSMALVNGYEAGYAGMHAAPFLTATYPSCLKAGGDVYVRHTTPYPNSSINALGLATAADSLAAIRKLVYEDRQMTLEELTALLDGDWEADPVLRSRILHKFPRYGSGDPAADTLAARIVQDLSDLINGVPNAKGGVYRLGLFSIDWRIEFGEHTAASADGRRAGEPLSQNTGASFGADREGATGHIRSVTAINAENTANGAILDLDFHASAVSGKNGITVMLASLKTYLQRGGFAIHYNVMDTDTLRDAMVHPERYPNLQVRLCGWNVKFTELSPAAQREFIRRSENQAG